MNKENEFVKDFITVGELREMLSILDDKDLITVNTSSERKGYHKIQCLEDSTSISFWELKCE